MKKSGPEIYMPWNKEQAEGRLSQLEDRLVDLRPVLERFSADHVHWLHSGVPLFFRLVPEIFRVCMPITDSIFNFTLESFLKMQSLPGSVSSGILRPKGGFLWSAEKALRFQEIDFRVPIKRAVLTTREETSMDWSFFINTTKVEGSDSIYQVFTESRRNFDYLVYENDQEIINTLTTARV